MSAAAIKRFWGAVTVAAREADAAWAVLLDDRPLRTPGQRPMHLPTAAFAEAVADEWRAVGDTVQPLAMPLTRLANSAIDAVRGREAEIAADIAGYAAADLLCYRAAGPAGLVARQAAAWDAILAGLAQRHGLAFAVTTGIGHVAQPAAMLERVRAMLGAQTAFRLAALHIMTTLTGSAALALSVADGVATAEEAWAAAHVDEDFQAGQWGSDAAAMARRAARWRDFASAARVLALTVPARPAVATIAGDGHLG